MTSVYRKKWVVHVERITREKSNVAAVPVDIQASSLTITRLKMDKDSKSLLERKSKNKDKKEDAALGNVSLIYQILNDDEIAVCQVVSITHQRLVMWTMHSQLRHA